MALAKCKDCGNEVSKKAQSCPTCGAPLKGKKVGCFTLLLSVFLAIVVIGIIGVIVPQVSKRKSTEKAQQEISQEAEILRHMEKEEREAFLATIDDHYRKASSLYKEKKLELAANEAELFKKHGKLDYKDMESLYKKVMIANLEQKVRPIPASRVMRNLDIYKQLLKLDPDNPKYKKKVAFYRKRVAEEAYENNVLSDFRKALKVEKFSWSRNGFGSVAKWKVLVKNISSKYSFKDMKFKTKYWGESGTMIDESLLGHTEFTVIKPKSKKWIKFEEFCHSQARSASVEIIKAERAY